MTELSSPELPSPGASPPDASLSEQTRLELRAIIARYPQPRSALLPMLHLVQSEQGFVSPEGVAMCAEELGLTKAEVGAVATFYTMYRRRPAGEYHVGICTNTLCAVLGGDELMARAKQHLGIGNNETTADGRVSLEHVECNAACDYAPVVMVNWEFFDDQTPESLRELLDGCLTGAPRAPTRGPSTLCTFKQASRVLAGFADGRASEGVQAGPATLAGLELAKQRGDRAPALPGRDAPSTDTSSTTSSTTSKDA